MTRCGFQVHMESLLGHLRGIEAPAVRAVLTAVLSEPIAAQERMPQIV